MHRPCAEGLIPPEWPAIHLLLGTSSAPFDNPGQGCTGADMLINACRTGDNPILSDRADHDSGRAELASD